MSEIADQFIKHIENDFNASKEVMDVIKNLVREKKLSKGYPSVISQLSEMIANASSSIIIYTPELIEELLQKTSECAYEMRAVRYLLAAHINDAKYENSIQNLLSIGNIQFRDISVPFKYYLGVKDGQEILFGRQDGNKDVTFFLLQNDDVPDLLSAVGGYFTDISHQYFSREEKTKILEKYHSIKKDKKKLKYLKKFDLTESDLQRF